MNDAGGLGQYALETATALAIIAGGAWAKLQGGRLSKLETKVDLVAKDLADEIATVNRESEARSARNRETIATSVTAVHERLNALPSRDELRNLTTQITALNARMDAALARQNGGGNGHNGQ